MRKYIDPEHLKAVIKDHTYLLTDHINSTDYGMFWCGIEQAIDQESAADVRENRRGRWIKQNPLVDTEECSLCGYNVIDEEFETPFCPWCGARMDMRGEE